MTLPPLKLHVLIRRQRPDEPQTDTLKAWVVARGQRGANLLAGRNFTSVDSAIEHCDRKLLEYFRPNPPEIEYEVDDWQAAQRG